MTRLGRLLGRILGPRLKRDSAVPSFGSTTDAATLLRAAEIAGEAGQTRQALIFYGRALDGYLEAGDRRKAERICRIMLQLDPAVIRTRYTLAAIAAGRNRVRQARVRLARYMAAVQAAGAEHLAVPSLVELASVTRNARIRHLIAGALEEVARPDLARAIREGAAAPSSGDPWSRAVTAALTRPEQVDLTALVTS